MKNLDGRQVPKNPGEQFDDLRHDYLHWLHFWLFVVCFLFLLLSCFETFLFLDHRICSDKDQNGVSHRLKPFVWKKNRFCMKRRNSNSREKMDCNEHLTDRLTDHIFPGDWNEAGEHLEQRDIAACSVADDRKNIFIPAILSSFHDHIGLFPCQHCFFPCRRPKSEHGTSCHQLEPGAPEEDAFFKTCFASPKQTSWVDEKVALSFSSCTLMGPSWTGRL